MTIRFISPQEGDAYRDLRLFALKESPTAFGSSYEEESLRTRADFEERLRRGSDPTNGILGAWDDTGRLVGMIGFTRENRRKRNHIGSLWSMYVLPEFRQQGLGKQLLGAALSHARQLGGVRQVYLAVTATNVAACALYAAFGFVRFGVEPDALFVEGGYLDHDHLVLRLEA